MEEEEDKKRQRKYFCSRDLWTQYKVPVAKKQPRIMYLSAHFAGRAIWSGSLIVIILLGARSLQQDTLKPFEWLNTKLHIYLPK